MEYILNVSTIKPMLERAGKALRSDVEGAMKKVKISMGAEYTVFSQNSLSRKRATNDIYNYLLHHSPENIKSKIQYYMRTIERYSTLLKGIERGDVVQVGLSEDEYKFLVTWSEV